MRRSFFCILLRLKNNIMKYLLYCLLLLPFSTRAQWHFTKVKEELVFSNAPFPQCHASTMVQAADGSLVLAAFGGSHEGGSDVGIWLTTQENDTWQAPSKVAEGVEGAKRYACWNPVLFQLDAHTLWLFYKVGPNPREWWGMLKTSTDNGKTWSAGNRLPAGILGPIKNKPVRAEDGAILSPSSVEVSENKWQAHIERTTDEGKHWEFIPIDPDNTAKVIQPSILHYPNHILEVVCRSNQDHLLMSWSRDDGQTWSHYRTTVVPNPNSGADAVTLKDGVQLLVYNPTQQGKDWFNGRGKLAVAMCTDGSSWKQVMLLEDGDNQTDEFSYPAIIQTSDGAIHISYTYKRQNIKHVVLKETVY